MASLRAKRYDPFILSISIQIWLRQRQSEGGRLPRSRPQWMLRVSARDYKANAKQSQDGKSIVRVFFFFLDHADSIWQNIFFLSCFFFFLYSVIHPDSSLFFWFYRSFADWHAASRCNESLLFVSTSGNILTDSSRYLLLVGYLWYFWERYSVSLAYIAR